MQDAVLCVFSLHSRTHLTHLPITGRAQGSCETNRSWTVQIPWDARILEEIRWDACREESPEGYVRDESSSGPGGWTNRFIDIEIASIDTRRDHNKFTSVDVGMHRCRRCLFIYQRCAIEQEDEREQLSCLLRPFCVSLNRHFYNPPENEENVRLQISS